MVVDEWHLQLHLTTDPSTADTLRIRGIVSAALDSFCEELQERVRAEVGDAGAVISVSQ